MGKRWEEVWQSINDLDDRVTRLEEREDVQTTPQPRPFRVGDVVRLEAGGARYNNWMPYIGKVAEVIKLPDADDDLKVRNHDGSETYWPASALTLIRAAMEPDGNARTCNICGLPLTGSMIGNGDGTGQKFAHPDCYYRKKADALTVERDEARRALIEAKQQRDKFWSQRDDALNKLDTMTAERDALRADLKRDRVYDTPDCTYNIPLECMEHQVGELLQQRYENHKTIREQRDKIDALRARIDAGVVVWGSYQSGGLCFAGEGARDETDTHTALLIDARPIAPIAATGEMADERRGERRKGLEICMAGRFKRTEHSAYYQGDRRHPIDRRRTAGTIADRKEATHETA